MRRLKSAVSLDTLFKSTDWKISSHPYGLIINWEIEIRFLFFVLRWKQLGVQAGSFTCWQWRSFRRSPRRAPGVPPGLLIWRLRAISRVQQCFTLFFFSLWPCEGGKKATQTTLESCPVTVHQPSKVAQAEFWEGGASGLLTLLGSGSTLTKQTAAAAAGACPSHT